MKTYASFNIDGFATLRLVDPPEAIVVGELAGIPARSGNRHLCRILAITASGTDRAGDKWYDVRVKTERA